MCMHVLLPQHPCQPRYASFASTGLNAPCPGTFVRLTSDGVKKRPFVVARRPVGRNQEIH